MVVSKDVRMWKFLKNTRLDCSKFNIGGKVAFYCEKGMVFIIFCDIFLCFRAKKRKIPQAVVFHKRADHDILMFLTPKVLY